MRLILRESCVLSPMACRLLVSLQRLSLTLDKMGEANGSIISYEDLLSTALGESGLDLDDLFGNVPGNVLSQATLK